MSKVILNRVKAGDLELKEKVVAINRVVKTTKGGRAFSFSALVVVAMRMGLLVMVWVRQRKSRKRSPRGSRTPRRT
jgi:ribosomal protein S5